MENNIYTAIKVVFAAVMTTILFLLLFFQNTEYKYNISFLLSNLSIAAVLIGIVAIGVSLYCFAKKRGIRLPRYFAPNFDWLAIGITVILFFVQIYIFYNIFFLTAWDVLIIRESAELLVDGNSDDFMYYFGNYFSTYPNNFLILYLNTLLLKINDLFGLFSKEYAMMCGVILNCMINSLACFLVYKTVSLKAEKKTAFIGFCLVILLVGFSPWSVIFYSDSVGIIVPILTLYLYIKPVAKKILRYLCRLASVAVGITGYFIKPQCLIMLIAILIIEIIRLICDFKVQNLKRAATVILSFVVCFAVVTQTLGLVNKKLGIEIDAEKALGITHFFMMGLNEESGGTYSVEDVEFSKSFVTAGERKVANIQKSVERLKGMGIVGYVGHIGKKVLTTFNDGTFAWGGNKDTFYYNVPQKSDNRISAFFKSLYYDGGSRNAYFFLFEQFIWIAVLIFSVFSVFSPNNKNRKLIAVISLAVLGLILFECLFEVRARYLYTFAPVFCVLATFGIKEISKVTKNATERLKVKRGN